MAKKTKLQSRKRRATSPKVPNADNGDVNTGLSRQQTVNTKIIIPESPYGPAIVEDKPIPLDKVLKRTNVQR